MQFRKRIYEIIEKGTENDVVSKTYDILMLIIIFISVIPIMYIEQNSYLVLIDKITVNIFIVDYLLRLWTADFKLKESRVISTLKYPITFIAIIDLLSILPSILPLSAGLKSLKMIRVFRVFRLFKTVRYSKSMQMMINVFEKEKQILQVILGIALMFVFMSALFIFQIEHEAQPNNFNNFFSALWWAFATLTTVGYGDIYPITNIGRVISMILSIMGIALVALPSGIITAGFVNELKDFRK